MYIRILTQTLTLLFSIIVVTSAQAEQNQPLNEDPLHDKAVKLAREGNYQEGLDLLQQILDKNPDNYAVQRDYIIIATWMDDCETALQRHELIAHLPNRESYLILPVSECLAEQARREQAIKMLKDATKRWPDDQELKDYLVHLEKEQRHETAPLLSFSLWNDTSDQGNIEWKFATRYSHQILDNTRAYARFFMARADDPDFETGDYNRLGAGIIYNINYQFTVDVEVSTDVRESGEGGIAGTLLYQPNTLWELGASYTTFAEDIPLRAKAQDISSDRGGLFADYHNSDYRWTAYANANQYNFTDGNERKTLYGELGYAYYLQPKLENRLILEAAHSRNTLLDTVYYNPIEDQTVNFVNRVTVVWDSRFVRHVDHFTLYIGNYWQEGFDSNFVGGIGVQQEYDFTEQSYFTWRLSLDSAVYDGNREQETHVFVSYVHTF